MQVYIDDVVVKSELRNDHLKHLKLSFERMRKHGLKNESFKMCFWCICR